MEKYTSEEEKVDTEMLFWEKLIELQVRRLLGNSRLWAGTCTPPVLYNNVVTCIAVSHGDSSW